MSFLLHKADVKKETRTTCSSLLSEQTSFIFGPEKRGELKKKNKGRREHNKCKKKEKKMISFSLFFFILHYDDLTALRMYVSTTRKPDQTRDGWMDDGINGIDNATQCSCSLFIYNSQFNSIDNF